MALQTRPTLEDEEIFDSQATFRSQYRFETTEDDLVQDGNDSLELRRNNDHCIVIDEEANSQGDSNALKQEISKEQMEKRRYRSLYLELQERCYHYQSMMEEYERLYSEFLTKCIKAEKDKMEMSLKL